MFANNRGAEAVMAGLLLTALANAQVYGSGSDGALAPTSNVTLDTSVNGGVFQFTSIAIPAGVTVRIIGSNSAILLCQGTVSIAGALDASGVDVAAAGLIPTAGGPGGYAGGVYLQGGQGPGGGPPGVGSGQTHSGFSYGGIASHANPGTAGAPGGAPPAPTYGAALPFDLRGGSGGGGMGLASLFGIGMPATGGGGTVVILAAGSITVPGEIRANGGRALPGFYGVANGGFGAGGSILIRSLQCVQVTGSITATAGWWMQQSALPGAAGLGFVRIDSYRSCGAPALAGASIVPAPYLAPLPFVTSLTPARIGQVCAVRAAAAPGDYVRIYASFGTSSIPVPPFGTIQLDLSTAWLLGQAVLPLSGHDPLVAFDVPVPNDPGLVGLAIHLQAINSMGTVAGLAQLSNLLTLTIGS